MGIKILHMSEALYCKQCGGMTLSARCPHSKEHWIRPSGTKVRSALVQKTHIPEEMMRPEIVRLLLREKELFV
jgi:sulfate adenylyltransferase